MSSLSELVHKIFICLVAEVSRPHTVRHTPTVVLPSPNGKFVSEAATYTTQNKHRRKTPILSAVFETAIPEIKGLQTYVLDRTATERDL